MCIKRYFRQFVLIGGIFSSFGVKASFYETPPEGFLWYKDKPLSLKPKEENKSETSVSLLAKGEEARKRNNARKERLDAAIQIALDNPTLENTRRAQREQKVIFDHSENFAKSWTLAAVIEGIIETKRNANSLALQVQRKAERREYKRKLKRISQHWGLALFVNPSCLHCKRFAPILEKFAKSNGFQVLALSKGGHDFGSFKGRPDRGILDSFNPGRESPVLFLMHKSGKSIFPVARGITDADSLAKNIISVAEHHQNKGANG